MTDKPRIVKKLWCSDGATEELFMVYVWSDGVYSTQPHRINPDDMMIHWVVGVSYDE